MTKPQLRIVCYVIIIPAMVVLNFAVLEPVFILDPCEESVPGWIKIFYTINGSTGFHPEPNLLNFVLTLGSGALLGNLITNVISRSARNMSEFR